MRLVTVPGVFRPRSDGALLARVAAERVGPRDTVLDPFTGSGILAIAAARAGAREVVAVDISRRAVACARLNARLNGVRIQALRGDLFAPVRERRFSLIVANPPYVPSRHSQEPRGAARAWEAGLDGRALLDRLSLQAANLLEPGGELLVVHSSICGREATLERLEQSGLDGEIVHVERGGLGPILAERRDELERRGMIEPGSDEEELIVISARHSPPEWRARRTGRFDRWKVRESPRTATVRT